MACSKVDLPYTLQIRCPSCPCCVIMKVQRYAKWFSSKIKPEEMCVGFYHLYCKDFGVYFVPNVKPSCSNDLPNGVALRISQNIGDGLLNSPKMSKTRQKYLLIKFYSYQSAHNHQI